jgi:predicted ArsR family transcriptional regulator
LFRRSELRNNGVVKNARKMQERVSEAAEQAAHRNTRDRVARSILDHGPSSASDLAERLGLTQAAVRRHLDAMVAAGLVEPREQRVYGHRGRGRPAKVFALTDSGRSAFYQAYDQLAAEAMRFIAERAGGGEAGAEAVAAFARTRLAAQADRYRAAVAEAGAEDGRTPAEALAEALSADGYAAGVRRVPSAAGASGLLGEQLCQHHCPVAHIAEQFPQFCEAETEVFSEVLGTHVQRLATIAHGDGVCTTYVPGTAGTAVPAGPQQPRNVPQPNDRSTTPSGRNPA